MPLKALFLVLKLDSLKDNPKLFQYYTAYYMFVALFHYLKPKARHMIYPNGPRTVLDPSGLMRR